MISRQLETLLHRSTITAHILQLKSLFLKTALLQQDSYCVSQFIHHAASVSVSLARSIFDDLPNTPPLFAWNSLIRAYTRTPSPIESVKMFALMLRVGLKADKFSFPFVVKACGHCLLIGEGGCTHSLILKSGFGRDKYIGNTLLRMYAALNKIDLARKVFDEMTNRDVVSWSSMIAACVACDCALDAFQVFQHMKLANEKPNHVTLVSMLSACSNLSNIRAGRSVHAYIVVTDMELDTALGTSLLEMYSKCGHIEEAFRVFNLTTEKNLQSWTVMLSGLADHGRGKDAISLFHEMQKTGIKPDSISFSAIFSACSHLGLVDQGRMYFEQMEAVYGISPTIEHYGCMVDLLGRAGLIEEALGLIQNMPMEPNSIILRSLIGACTNHGQALHLDHTIRKLLLKLEPDLGTNYVLAANLSSLSCSWKDAADLRSAMKTRGVKKSAGCSWL